ncbi:MAG: Tim44 domain-containing protein [Rhodobacteraceae bacterium]|nr:Tim44 domain-containing protein [Paracoccaceae bacterium]
MGSSLLQLIALAAVAIYLVFRLRNTLGTRDGFENPTRRTPRTPQVHSSPSEPEEAEVDYEITQFADAGSSTAIALAAMKQAEPGFSVEDFVAGARAAYEQILIGFAKGEIEDLKPFLALEVYESFKETVDARNQEGHSYEAKFVGLRETKLVNAEIDAADSRAEIGMQFVGEVISYVTDAEGNIVEGDPETIRRQRDSWIFARRMGSSDPNWELVATGE